MRLILLTTLTMIAFAANSILTRLAVDGGYIDANSFALIRVLSGAIVLSIMIVMRGGKLPLFRRARAVGALSLAAYMVGFSIAYQTLDAGLGALIMFGVVQISMFMHGAKTGAGPSGRQMIGAGVAFSGLLLALWPGSGGQATIVGSASMVIAGLGWAAYTISGKSATDPLAATTANFLLCLPILAVLLLSQSLETTTLGWVLAIVCGGVTSGLGYALWYTVLPAMQQSVAAVVQLSVPVIALLGGAIFLGEAVTLIVGVATAMVLCGIAVAVTSQSSRADHK